MASTRADLRTRILDDLTRTAGTAWNSRVNNAIDDACNFYQRKRFYFNESRTVTFSTVAGTDTYTFNTPAITGTNGAEFHKIDNVYLTVGGTVVRLHREDPDRLEYLADNLAGQSIPTDYAQFSRTMRFYPNPNAIYTVRIIGHLKYAGPVDDLETTNVWMNEGFELIRSRAKAQIAMHILEDEALATRMETMERSALSSLMQAGFAKMQGGSIEPTQF